MQISRLWTHQHASVSIAIALMLSGAGAFAQTKISCQINLLTGDYVAPLAWQNTLGTARADAMCSAGATALARAEIANTARPSALPGPPEVNRYQLIEGEKASQAMRRWALAQGYSFVWDAPKQSDAEMKAGHVEAIDFADALNKFITALNTKLLERRLGNSIESQFTFPVEATAYSNKVVVITVKQ